MDYKKQYKDEMNKFCDDNLTLTAEDILNKADNRSRGVVTDLKGAHKHMNIRTKIAAIAAACVITTGITGAVAGAAGYGPMADLFAKKATIESSDKSIAQTDKISSSLVNQGYVLELNETKTSGNYSVTFNGITGDITNPQLLFTIKVNDSEFAKSHNTLNCTVYGGLSEEAYAHRIDKNNKTIGSYMYSNVVAFQDKDDPSVYYLSMLGNSAWITENSHVVVEFRSIVDGNNENMLNMVYKFKMPKGNASLKNVKKFEWDVDQAESIKAPNKINYYLTSISFGEYETQVEFYFDISNTKYSKNISKFYDNYDKNAKELIGFVKDMKLVVDGKEYSPIENSYGVYCDQKDGLCSVAPYFPSINYEKAKNITIKYGDKEIVIKGNDNKTTTEETTVDTTVETTVITAETNITEETTITSETTAVEETVETSETTSIVEE